MFIYGHLILPQQYHLNSSFPEVMHIFLLLKMLYAPVYIMKINKNDLNLHNWPFLKQFQCSP